MQLHTLNKDQPEMSIKQFDRMDFKISGHLWSKCIRSHGFYWCIRQCANVQRCLEPDWVGKAAEHRSSTVTHV